VNAPIIKNALRQAAKYENEKDRPLVCVLVSNVPHAMICIIHGGNLYTVGFGYYGEDKKVKKIIDDRMRHALATIKGALYTPDYLLPHTNDANPEYSQGSKLAWIGYLDTNMCDRIDEYLSKASNMIYEGNCNTDASPGPVTNYYLLLNDANYNELAAINPGTDNCIEWAQKIIGIRLACGYITDPRKCSYVTEEDWNEIIDNYKSTDELYHTIKRIQTRLEPGLCTNIGKTLGLCGGKRKLNTRMNKLKNKRNSKRRHTLKQKQVKH
jgi:hypothetical protein